MVLAAENLTCFLVPERAPPYFLSISIPSPLRPILDPRFTRGIQPRSLPQDKVGAGCEMWRRSCRWKYRGEGKGDRGSVSSKLFCCPTLLILLTLSDFLLHFPRIVLVQPLSSFLFSILNLLISYFVIVCRAQSRSRSNIFHVEKSSIFDQYELFPK